MTIALIAAVAAPALPQGPSPGSAVRDTLLRLPLPPFTEGPHPVRPLPFDPGALVGISSEQDRIHHGRRYAAFVSRWNEIEHLLRESAEPASHAEALGRVGEAVHTVTFHELHWWALTPRAGEATEHPEAVEATLAPPAPEVIEGEQGWILVTADRAAGRLERIRLTDQGQTGLWGCVPVIAFDLYQHAHAIDREFDRPGFVAAVWPQIQPAAVDARLAWVDRLRADRANGWTLADEPPDEEEMARRNAAALRGTLCGVDPESSPAVSPDELATTVAQVLGETMSEEALVRWFAWAPDFAVLAWEPHSGTPLLLTVADLADGGVWGATPLLTVPRRDRPRDLDAAREALGRLPWGDIRRRMAPLLAAGPGAEL